MDIKSTSDGNISKFGNNGKLNGWRTVENWTYNEERKGKYPKDSVFGEGRHEMERNVGYKMRKKGGKCPKCSLRGSELKRKGKLFGHD